MTYTRPSYAYEISSNARKRFDRELKAEARRRAPSTVKVRRAITEFTTELARKIKNQEPEDGYWVEEQSLDCFRFPDQKTVAFLTELGNNATNRRRRAAPVSF